MLDKENLKRIIKAEWDNYSTTVEKLGNPIFQENETLRRYYERHKLFIKCRIDGMKDLLYDLGYIVLISPNGDIDITERQK